ncbi:MAG: TolC family protein [Bacteroidales bacterium]|jgi:outer membrane protein TolC|nr:TolC family protein [Bacteroidales bacterium]MDD2264917.1 TolC family protein [Bacteroidales bacterium]MDD2831911.1 TolC family protein [Bacteroidales bacterium]MDD3209377.1 TolC family protein [Bacteroidales bacterium]MDD3698043.1 TolC family protein [Bacteroidales bacterium]
MKRIFFALFFFFIITERITAQDMNLNQCIRYALENNLTYANKNIETDIANEQYRQSKRNFLPSLNAGSSANKQYGRSIDPTTNTFINQAFFSMNFYLDSQLDLFRGFTRLNTAKFQKLQYLISRENVKQQEMEIAFLVMNKYYDVLYFSNLQNIVQEQVELTTLNLQKTEKLIELGLKAESDLLEMRAQEATELHNLVLAQNQHDLALLALKNLMNYPSENELHIVIEEIPISTDMLLSPDIVYATAVRHMPAVLRANLEVEASQKRLNIARGELSPRLSFGAGIYTNYADSRKEHIDPNNLDNSPMHIIPFNDQWSQNMAQSIFLNVQIPILNKWNGMSHVKQARLERLMAVNRQQEERQKLYQFINEDIQQLKSLQNERNLLRAKKDALQEAYIISEKKLEQGLINVIEFYTAKNQFAQAEADWMRTLLQLKVKEQTIRFYMGEKIY